MAFVRPDPLNLTFEGFPEEGLVALAELRADPHVGRYQELKPTLDRCISAPFKRYRDDLVVNWVFPNGLPFETERNVFGRILKNDFGAGGSHHHLWMSFYRPHRTRLTDVQLSHGVYPDGFRFGLFLGDRAKGLFGPAKRRMADESKRTAQLVAPLAEKGYGVEVRKGSAPKRALDASSDDFAPELQRASHIWVSSRLSRDEVLSLGPKLVARGIDAAEELMPLYSFIVETDALDERS